jgi:MFS transporter, OFA family, oxalate/formate antiporter
VGASSQVASPGPRIVNRWGQLIAGIIAMTAIANLQYAWTLFTTPLTHSLHASLTMVQWAFAAFVLCETWLVPFEGYLVDKLGPRLLVLIGGVLVGVSWIGSGYAATVGHLIFWYAVGGVGAGIVYGATVGNAIKWFPDHRGLCVGLVAGAYGIGTAITVAPIAKMMRVSGYGHTFVFWGYIQGIVVVITALFVVRPPAGWQPPGWNEKAARIQARVRMTEVDYTPTQMLGTGTFWVIYLMMTIIAFGGLVVTAQLKPIAIAYHVDKVIVAFGMTALVLAITLNRIFNGVTRPFWGWVSDHIGRENAMFIAFTLEALSVFGLLQLVHRPVWFIILSSFAFFAWGEIFSLFPSITGDLFGRTWATTNYGFVYTAKGLAAIFAGPMAAYVKHTTGSWIPVFWAMIACDLIAAFMALLWLKPMAGRTIARAQMLHAPTGGNSD